MIYRMLDNSYRQVTRTVEAHTNMEALTLHKRQTPKELRRFWIASSGEEIARRET